MTSRKCPECSGAMVHEIRPIELTYKGEAETAMIEGDYCLTCGEGVHTGKDLDESDLALNRMKARVEGLLLPAEIKRIRQKLHLNQRQAGDVLGGGPNAFYRYERGDLLPSAAISNLLRVMDAMPEALDVLLPERKLVAA